MRVLCSDNQCIYNENTGYYSLCKLMTDNSPGYGGIDRIYRETCDNKMIKEDLPIILDKDKLQEFIKINISKTSDDNIVENKDKLEIKECKYCGFIPKVRTFSDNENIEDYYFIDCDNDNCNSDIITDLYDICDKNAEEKCIKEWNELNSVKENNND